MIALLARLTGLDARAAALVGWALVAGVLGLAAATHAVTATRSAADRVSTARTAGIAEGRAAERTLWAAAAARERERQAEANAAAVAAAEAEALALRRDRDDLARSLEDLAHAADAAPDRDDLCLDPDGLRAVNRHR